jgi:hypothetical protein
MSESAASGFPAPMPGSPSNASSASADSPTLPRTPETPSSTLQPMLPDLSSALTAIGHDGAAPAPVPGAAAAANAAAAKRKSSRRANTAERRATHNAVERQRRETLNGRFLDLAGLLPNLSQIRRPSKSAIVNSSIAHIHASRRHRTLAARELRHLKLEADAYRREINQWRERSGLPGIEEPARSDAFALVLSGEIELEQELAGFGENFEGGSYLGPVDEEDGYDDEDEYMQHPAHAQQQQQMAMAQQQMAAAVVSPAHEPPNPFSGLQRQLQQSAAPRIPGGAAPAAHMMAAGFDPSGVPYGTFDSRLHPHGHPSHFQSAPTAHYVNGATVSVEDPTWAHNVYNTQIAVKGTYTPPMSAHGGMGPYGLLRAQQQQMMNSGHVYGSPVDGDDGSSGVGSAPSTGHGVPLGRARSNSSAPMPVGSYDQEYSLGSHGAPVSIPQGRPRGMSVNTAPGPISNVASWDGVGSPMGVSPHGAMGMKASPIAIPGAAVNMSAGAAMAMMF